MSEVVMRPYRRPPYKKPVKMVCLRCKHEWESVAVFPKCPKCGEIVAVRELVSE